ncbi:NAD(P)-dependent oxidoreductase [Kineosporia babensis]|uniref:SDR family oxidoreductase n=1 Tax=Kineosporia babensis TaxID=499548 RepID=A0A9X1NHF7_9ACTN|nr:SDR family oxidoreductase [Kineosporia babensis]MCD5313934.1 SDR family oxidoreductase [Kineosporia babensis]
MRLTIFGATGGTGQQVVEQAVDAGHEVTVVVRNPDRLTRNVRVVRADLDTVEAGTLEGAVRDSDAVLSCLGPRSKAEAAAGVVAKGTDMIIRAMKETNTRRLIVISAVPVGSTPSPARPEPGNNDPGDSFMMRRIMTPIIKVFFGTIYEDLAVMEDEVRASGLDWTIVRPPRLLDRKLTGQYRTNAQHNIPGGRAISRADLAHFMVQSATRQDDIQQIVRVAY